MHRLESELAHLREMVLDDISKCRIELLMLMARNYRQGAPLGPPRQAKSGKDRKTAKGKTRQAPIKT